MNDKQKTKPELLVELNDLRQQVAKLQSLSLSENSDNELNMQTLVDELPAFISYLDVNYCYKYVNQLYVQWLNKPREQIIGQQLRTIVGDDGYLQAMPYLDKAFSGAAVSYETHLQEQDGTHIYEVKHTPDIQQGKVQGIFILVTDITVRKKAKEELVKKEKTLSNAQRIAHLASVDWDLINDQAEVSGEHADIFGVGSEYFNKNARERFLQLVHPDDREFVNSELNRAINDRVTVYYDYRIILEDDSIRYVHDCFEVVCNENEEVIRLFGTTQDITERKNIEELLRAEKEFAEGLIEIAQAVVLVLDAKARIVRFNPYFEDISGYTLQEVKGKDWFTTFIPKHDQQRIRTLFATAINKNKTLVNINSILTRDGCERIIRWYDTTMLDSNSNITGLLAIGIDITEQQQEALRLEQYTHQLREAQRIAGLARWDLDLVKNSCQMSSQHADIYGEEKRDLTENGFQTWLKSVHPDDRERVQTTYQDALKSGDGFDYEYRLVQPSGQIRYAYDRGKIFRDESGRAIRITGTTQDITRYKEIEQALILARDEADRANLAKSEFVSRMSHELRTPMNAILGFGQVLELDADGFDESQKGNIREILDAGYHLLNLINDVLDLAKIESGKMEVSMEGVAVDDVLRQCIALISSQAEARQLELIDHISSKGYTVQADFTRLKQVLLNMLSNAVKYNREHGRISLNSETIDKHRIRISVTDTGKGMTEDDIDKLYTPFERMGTERNIEGTGIGLVITKYLIELMGGTIGVESTLGEGSTFWVELELSHDV